MLRHTKGFLEREVVLQESTPEERSERAWSALGATVRGDLRHTSGWAGECAWEEWSKKKRACNKRYRSRHRERDLFFNRIYVARHRARARGIEPPPIPDWNNNPDVFEVSFARGGCPKTSL